MKRILGVDYGRARVGIAVSDELGMLAHPLETAPARDAAKRIAAIAAERSIDDIVVGIPRNMSGTSGPAEEEAKAFCAGLRKISGRNVIEWDERLSTVAAQRALHESGRNAKNSRPIIDQVAAQMILQAYLDHLEQKRNAAQGL